MNGAIGQPVSRLDGRAKVTGSARYTADTPIDGVQHAVLVPSTIPHGSVDAIDTATAETSPGVLKVLTHLNTPRLQPVTVPVAQAFMPLQTDRIEYEGQPVAIVVADTLENATHAAAQVAVSVPPVTLPDRLPYGARSRHHGAVVLRAGQSDRRSRRGAGRRAGQAGPYVPHGRPSSQSDGTLRHHCAMERRRPFAGARQRAGCRPRSPGPGHGLRAGPGRGAGEERFCRRRFRLQGVRVAAPAVWRRSPPARSAGRSSWCSHARSPTLPTATSRPPSRPSRWPLNATAD